MSDSKSPAQARRPSERDQLDLFRALPGDLAARDVTDGKIIAVAASLKLARSPLFVVSSASSSSSDRPASGVRPDRPSNVRPVVDLSALVPQSGTLFVHRASEARSQ